MALPFIADDIFIHWDDERTAGAFALARLAKKMQVVVLTHHEIFARWRAARLTLL